MTDDLVQRLLIAPISCVTSEQCSEHRKLLDEAATRVGRLESTLKNVRNILHNHGYVYAKRIDEVLEGKP